MSGKEREVIRRRMTVSASVDWNQRQRDGARLLAIGYTQQATADIAESR